MLFWNGCAIEDDMRCSFSAGHCNILINELNMIDYDLTVDMKEATDF